MGRFDDQAVIVTGAGIGIGNALCRGFAREGAFVLLNDVDGERAEAAARRINGELGEARVEPHAGDVSDVAVVRSAVDGFADRRGRLDVVIANAGITRHGSFLDETPEGFDALVGVNLRGSYFTAQHAARAMIARKAPGRILLMSSVAGFCMAGNLSGYGVTKAGIRMMALALAIELGPHGITVNALAPGATLTERTADDDPFFAEHWAGVTPTRRVGRVEDTVGAAMFLASKEARHVNGQTLVVDGGWTGVGHVPEGQP